MQTESIKYNILSQKEQSDRLPRFGHSVIFFDANNSNNNELTSSLKKNKSWFDDKFGKANFGLINASELVISNDLNDTISYIFPNLTDDKLTSIQSYFTDTFSNFNASQYLLNYLEYEGDIKSGFLIIDKDNYTISIHECLSTQDLLTFTNNYIGDFFYGWEYGEAREPDYMLPFGEYKEPIDSVDIDEDSKEAIEKILHGISTVNENGDLLKILPFIEKYLSACKQNHLNSISHLYVDENYNIVLSGYDITIKLSPLTMAVYLLFLDYPSGILPTDLHLHKNELLANYSKISARADYSKIQKSIDDMIDPKSNALYVHFSRIKSAFVKKIHIDLAINYYIIGEKNKPKFIKLNRHVVKVYREKIIFSPFDHEDDDPNY